MTARSRSSLRQPSSPASRPRAFQRRGFTLVELLVALVLVNVGLLALVAASAAVTRELGEGARRARALQAAAARLERLQSVACDGDEQGDAPVAPGVHEWWSTRVGTAGTQHLSDSVAYVVGAATRAVVLDTRGAC